jgi:ribosomal protein L33
VTYGEEGGKKIKVTACTDGKYMTQGNTRTITGWLEVFKIG